MREGLRCVAGHPWAWSKQDHDGATLSPTPPSSPRKRGSSDLCSYVLLSITQKLVPGFRRDDDMDSGMTEPRKRLLSAG